MYNILKTKCGFDVKIQNTTQNTIEAYNGLSFMPHTKRCTIKSLGSEDFTHSSKMRTTASPETSAVKFF